MKTLIKKIIIEERVIRENLKLKDIRSGKKIENQKTLTPLTPIATENIKHSPIPSQIYYYYLVTQSCLFVTPWTAAHQASLSFAISWSLHKFISIELVMLCNHPILYHSLLFLPSMFPSISVFGNESALSISGQSIGASTSALVFPMNIQG